MDDILHAPRDEDAQQAGLPLAKRLERYRAAWMDGMARVRLGARRFQHKLDEATAGGKRLFTPLNFLAVAAVVGVATVVATVYTPSYVVSVDGVPLGTVSDPQVFEDVMDRVEARAATILGYDYEIPSTVSYTFALSERGKLSDTGEFETYLFDQIGAVMKSYVLKVDGTFIGAAADRESLDALLDAIKAPYRTENTVSADFTSNGGVSHEYTPSDVNQDLDAMLARLTQNTNGQTTYEVQKGDTFMQIAFDNDMSMSELEALNPDVDINRIYIGQLLNVKEEIPFLSVKTVDNVTYTQSIECPVVEVQDDSMYQGESKVLDAGVPGEQIVNADIAYLNGVEQERTVLSTQVTREATNKVIAVGTKVRPSWLPNGYFIWPVYGRITSYFGYRNTGIRGASTNHKGIDISVSYGTPIYAADGGVVSFSGYKGAMGYVVIIDHQNGFKTYYEHNSSLLVSAGQTVYKGQQVAKAGRSGVTSGVHCHFGIQYNGTYYNPLNYLS